MHTPKNNRNKVPIVDDLPIFNKAGQSSITPFLRSDVSQMIRNYFLFGFLLRKQQILKCFNASEK